MNFELCPNLGKFRSCDHPYKINFIFYTCVKPSEEIPNLEACFNLCPFPKILARRNDDTIFIDIIGEIVGMNEVKSITTAEGPTKLLNLQLKDLGDSLIDVALWGKLAEDVYSNIKSQPSGPVVFLGSLMKTLLYQGKGTVQSSKFTTKAYINSPLPEILQFQEALCNEEPRLAITEIISSKSAHISKQSFHLSERKTIIELMETNQVMTCNILASISLEPKASWFYIGCTLCFTKAKQYFNPETEEIEFDKYSCEKCGKQITTTQPRFKLFVKATDNTGSASLILFNDVVIPLIKNQHMNCLSNKFLLDLDGRNYVFKIMVKDEAKYNQSSTYKVISLTDVPDVIQSFSESAYTLNAIEQEIITVSGNSVGTSIGTSTQAEINFVDMEKLDNNEDNAYNVSTPKPTTKRSLATSKDVQQSSTKPKLMSKAQIKKEKK
ncbi:replication protein A 70 kDa DNA-binding subunit C isoform X2 [Arabidopsis lyrata subsp. lyrata]|nr:replication protein A 70 kDa DNA-binding subunit C isoform X2 [Arabidopsis lyrata subsp. lyrata]XP_020884812.1 replication protein A 70 kDa DNA-binding subunit C isoform X2 [Arabidopsis lyrata subsp. lyrata]|eukprot:XP_020884811.1 replication protein A 70 kDa DNA-binding subunit C isoform X2 [Arabidopsis lyrata subsp. lyrata]